ISAAGAANRFAALLGVCDLGMALIGGWTATLLCDTDRRRQFVVVVLVGVLAAFAAQGLNQYFVTLPATVRMFNENEASFLRMQGWSPGDPEIALFKSRLNSQAIFGFLTLSDVLAAALMPLLLISLALGSLALSVWQNKNGTSDANVSANKEKKSQALETQNQDSTPRFVFLIPALTVLLIFAAGLLVLVLTRSKGAMAATALSVFALIAGWVFRAWLANNRWKITVLELVGAVLIGSVIVGYGLAHHALPSKDLAYRWQYWTGAAGMIADHPVLGVGMNNFGYYYAQFKPLGAPEDVKDPHNMFIHVAAEAGWPAAILFVGLVMAGFLGAVRRDYSEDSQIDGSILRPEFLALFVLLWWGPKLIMDFLASITDGFLSDNISGHGIVQKLIWALFTGFLDSNVRECVLCIGAVLLGIFAANRAWSLLNLSGRRCVCLAAVLGAAGTALYDQINMAAVVGPTAMLFWITLGSFKGRTAPKAVEDVKEKNAANYLPAAGLLLAGAIPLFSVFVPVALGAFPLDPGPYQSRYQQALKQNQPAMALDAVNQILQRDTRSEDWLMKRIQLEIFLHENPRQDVLRLLDINRTDAKVRVMLAQSNLSGLTPAERIAQLRLALQLNAALPRDEITRLSDQQIAQILESIKQLQTQTGS
ncbi:MAG TPA: O-antigen ligase family protein, partial [Phycisphaerae bacterium]|nr:O-antigen ligase family protein [Phycisphaerae bacterium]